MLEFNKEVPALRTRLQEGFGARNIGAHQVWEVGTFGGNFVTLRHFP